MNAVNKKADLHLHTHYSDGYHSPSEIVDKAVAANLAAISITDHDEIGALPNAIEYGRLKGIEVLPGVELSVDYHGRDVHILAYCFDYQNDELVKHLRLFKDERVHRAQQIVDKLEKLGMPISFDAVLKKAGTGTVGRPHIANVLLDDGFVYSFQEAFDKYIGTDKPANVDKYKVDLTSVLKLVRAAGGVCCIAHPGIQLDEHDLVQLIEMGVQGIEVVHPRHGVEAMRFYESIATKYNLFMTGGSDFHGSPYSTEPLGKHSVAYEIVVDLKKLTNYPPAHITTI